MKVNITKLIYVIEVRTAVKFIINADNSTQHDLGNSTILMIFFSEKQSRYV